MASNRVKIRSLEGGTGNNREEELLQVLYDQLGVKFSKVFSAGDAFTVVCISEKEAEKITSETGHLRLQSKKFKPTIPPQVLANRTIVVKGLSHKITNRSPEDLKRDIEDRNDGLKVTEVIKMGTMRHIMKVQFAAAEMADKAIRLGLSIDRYHLTEIEKEDFIPLPLCWKCYKYNHLTKDCPTPNIQVCSECASTGHTFRNCCSETKKCLNCGGDHRTLAARCPTRKQLIENCKEQRKQTQVTEGKSFSAAVKAGNNATQPKPRQEQPVLQLDNVTQFKTFAIIIQAHLVNLARPGSFGNTIKELCTRNNLPTIDFPENSPSMDIFRTVMGNNISSQALNFEILVPTTTEDTQTAAGEEDDTRSESIASTSDRSEGEAEDYETEEEETDNENENEEEENTDKTGDRDSQSASQEQREAQIANQLRRERQRVASSTTAATNRMGEHGHSSQSTTGASHSESPIHTRSHVIPQPSTSTTNTHKHTDGHTLQSQTQKTTQQQTQPPADAGRPGTSHTPPRKESKDSSTGQGTRAKSSNRHSKSKHTNKHKH